MTSRIFRIFKPDETREDRVQKRRAQLRDAQKTYRDRRDRYARSLEEELARVRASEANLLREVDRLRSTVQTLVQALGQQGLDAIDESDVDSPIGYAGLHGLDLRSPGSKLGGPSDHLSAGFAASFGESSQHSSPQHHHEPDRERLDVCLGGRDPATSYGPDVRVCDLDPVVTGMEFVLTLERPCLGHLHGILDKPDEPGGHALTVSAHVLSAGSCPPESPPGTQPLPGTVCRDVPAAMLDSLLGLSSALCSEQEVTPVQAWNYIRCRPQFRGLEVQRLDKLARALRDAVKCHGFGAVVNRRFFENLVSQLLHNGQRF